MKAILQYTDGVVLSRKQCREIRKSSTIEAMPGHICIYNNQSGACYASIHLK